MLAVCEVDGFFTCPSRGTNRRMLCGSLMTIYEISYEHIEFIRLYTHFGSQYLTVKGINPILLVGLCLVVQLTQRPVCESF